MHSHTANGAISLSSTGSDVLNLFFKVLRTTDVESCHSLMSAAWVENPLLCLKAVFHLRDIRGGKGERKAFHECMKWIISNHSTAAINNMQYIPFYGTYKDLFLFVGTELESSMIKMYANTLAKDIQNLLIDNISDDKNTNRNITLAAKWAPSEGSGLDKNNLVKKLMIAIKNVINNDFNHLLYSQITNLRDYRQKIISPLRKHLDIVERKMCAGEWDTIEFSHVPSVAMCNLRKAFKTHSSNFQNYLDDVQSGKSKINSSVLFPHQLVEHYMKGGKYDETIELQWQDMVKKFKYSSGRSISLVDVSSSMTGLPMQVAIALGLLISGAAENVWSGAVITFTEKPTMLKIKGTLMEQVKQIRAAPWGGSTNLVSAFQLILDTAVRTDSTDNLPNTLYIFSDMQFNQASPSNESTNLEYIDLMYTQAGCVRPNIVFWNLAGDTIDFPAAKVDRCALVSGFSPSLMKLFVSGQELNPTSIMMSALDSPRYDQLRI